MLPAFLGLLGGPRRHGRTCLEVLVGAHHSRGPGGRAEGGGGPDLQAYATEIMTGAFRRFRPPGCHLQAPTAQSLTWGHRVESSGADGVTKITT